VLPQVMPPLLVDSLVECFKNLFRGFKDEAALAITRSAGMKPLHRGILATRDTWASLR
jgi:hypothetical protein